MWNSRDDDTYSIPPDKFGHYIDSFLDGNLAMLTVFRMEERWNFHADCRCAPTGTTASTEMGPTESWIVDPVHEGWLSQRSMLI